MKGSIRKLTIGVILFAICALFLYQIGLFGMVVWFKYRNPDNTPIMQATLLSLRATDPKANINYEWVSYDDINNNLKRAVIVSEDSGFMAHSGIEWDAIKEAWEFNLKQSDKGTQRRRGGSTISQQLAKNLFLSNSRNYLRKAQELVLTYMIELVMDKRRILELYLNIAQWGSATFGAKAAAAHYYKTTPDKLNATQASRLAAMLPSPAYYDKHGITKYLNSRIASIRARLHLVVAPK